MGKHISDSLAPSVQPVRNDKWGRWHLDLDEPKPGVFITVPGPPYQFKVAFKWLRTPAGRARWLDTMTDHPRLRHQDGEDFKQVLMDLEEQGVI